jgi:hypothetical protein
VYGPYLPIDRFKLGDPSGTNTIPGYLAIMDKYNRPILYYGTIDKPNIRLARGLVGSRPPDRPLYNILDNRGAMASMPLPSFAMMLGDKNGNGMIDPTENPAYEGPYLLWCAGPDELFGAQASAAPPVTLLDSKDADRCDDITNFRQ